MRRYPVYRSKPSLEFCSAVYSWIPNRWAESGTNQVLGDPIRSLISGPGPHFGSEFCAEFVLGALAHY